MSKVVLLKVKKKTCRSLTAPVSCKKQRNEKNSAIFDEFDKAFILKSSHFSCSGLHQGYRVGVLHEGFLYLVEVEKHFIFPTHTRLDPCSVSAVKA